MRRWIRGCFAATTGVLSALYFLTPHSWDSKLFLYNGVGLLAVTATVCGALLRPAHSRRTWWLFAAGQASFLVADVTFYLLENKYGETPFPSIADAFYLSMYPLVAMGLLRLVRETSPGRDRASLLDAATVATACFATFWVLFMDSSLVDSTLSPLGRVITLAYPVMDVVLIAVAARLVIMVHIRNPAYALICLSVLSLLIADTFYDVLNVNGEFQTGGFVDAFWLGFYVMFGLAAIQPVDGRPHERVRDETGRVTPRHISVMFLATLELPIVNLIWGNQNDLIVVTTASACLFVLVLIRVLGLMRTIERGQDKLRHDARHDALTGLANRTLFRERTAAAIAESPRRLFVLFIDLDDFKTVNDSLGHHAGDELLVWVARRLEACVREEDLVARLGGDEFALLLRTAVDRDDAASVAGRVLSALDAPVGLSSRQVRVGASVGIAEAAGTERDVDEFLRDADVAMYRSKERGKGRFEFFQQGMYDDVVDRLDLQADLAGALVRGEFTLHYQPIFELATNQLVRFEALLRWYHPTRGVVSPDVFVPLAEESGLIVPIGRWVLDEACRQTRNWQVSEPGHADLGVAVNLSVRQLHSPDILQTVADSLTGSGLHPQSLTLEITESLLATDTEVTTRALQQLKALRCNIALDDFGTGYSSLSYLRTFPVDHVKIDRTFVSELHRSSTSTALVRAVITIATALGASTTAEGIEHVDQARALLAMGCDHAQGYLMSRPLTAEAATALLRAESRGVRGADWLAPAEAPDDYVVEFVRGTAGVSALAPELERLQADTGCPVTSRWGWQAAWLRTHRSWLPLAVVVRAGDRGDLVAAAMLAVRNNRGGVEIAAVGAGTCLHAAMPSRNEEAAEALAQALADLLEAKSNPWTMALEQLDPFDAVTAALSRRIPGVSPTEELRVPRIVLDGPRSADQLLSKNQRKQIRRALRRIQEDGLDLRIDVHRGSQITGALRDEVERIHVERDHEMRRHSDLDLPATREFWREVVDARDGAWDVEITTLRLDGILAAYVVAIVDGTTYRVFDGRMLGRFADYSPGRIVETTTLDRVCSSGEFAVLDWMTGVAPEKILAANDAHVRVRLNASSERRRTRPARPTKTPKLDAGQPPRMDESLLPAPNSPSTLTTSVQ